MKLIAKNYKKKSLPLKILVSKHFHYNNITMSSLLELECFVVANHQSYVKRR